MSALAKEKNAAAATAAKDPSPGVDLLLTTHGKSLKIGEQLRFTLVKGPNTHLKPAADPVHPSAPPEFFPLVAKFPESVVKPDFTGKQWSTSRLYQQDVPKAEDDSDEEEPKPGTVRKRWRSRRKEAPKRQWILQEQVDFLQTMMDKRQRRGKSQQSDDPSKKFNLSSRYEGVPEHNPSQYMILQIMNDESSKADDEDDPNPARLQVTILPAANATVSFAQPASRKTLSMSEAEQAIENQRHHMTRFMMHKKPGALMGGMSGPKGDASKSRLLGKLTKKARQNQYGQEDEDDDDDVMGDLTFRNRKGAGKARKELLSTLGDSALKVDPDGVLGGANDSEFGRGQKFNRFQEGGAADKSSGDAKEKGADEDDGQGGRGRNTGDSSQVADGMAMADDFYKRDVEAEYEELDFDVNEQFDDDDVDVGEKEVAVDDGGYADDDDEDDPDEAEMDNEVLTGAEGLATVAGFKIMLARARGEITPEQAAEAAAALGDKHKRAEERENSRLQRLQQGDDNDDRLAQIMAGDENSGQAAGAQRAAAAPGAAVTTESTGVQVDENGLRVITLMAVRGEIWLHHGTIPMKRLMKIFDIKKKSPPERQNKFREVVRELCTVETDPIGGRMLVLKQHYSNMS